MKLFSFPKLRRALPVALAVTMLSVAAAQATPLTAAQIMANYNLVTAGNATTQSDIEGSAVIGGNFNGSTVFNNRAPAHPELDIYGANQSSSLNVNNGGVVHYHANTGHFSFNSGSTAVQDAFTYALSDILNPLNQLSSSLKGLTANSTIVLGGGKATFNAMPGANGIAVFSLTAGALQTDLNNNSFAFTQNGAKTIVVNVSGNFSEPSSANWNVPELPDVIFNFYDATSLSVRNWEGSILAPNAALTINGGAIEGFVYANSFGGGGEIHNYAFTGTLPTGKVPEPATISLLGFGLVSLVAGRRRLRRG